MSWFDCGLTFSHFYLLTSNLLPNFLISVTHSVFNIMSSMKALNQIDGSEMWKKVGFKPSEKVLVSLRGVYNLPFNLDDPVERTRFRKRRGKRSYQLTTVFFDRSTAGNFNLKCHQSIPRQPQPSQSWDNVCSPPAPSLGLWSRNLLANVAFVGCWSMQQLGSGQWMD